MPPPPGLRVKKGRARRATDADSLSVAGFEGTAEAAYLRYKIYSSVWERVKWKVEEVQRQENRPIVQQVCDFLQTFSNSKSGRHRSMIPVASVVTGVVRGENIAVFNSIRLKLQGTTKPYFARIDTSTKPTVKMILQSIMEQLNKQDFSPTSSSNSSSTKNTSLLERCRIHPLIILIEDVEQLDNTLLQDLLRLICSGRYKEYSVQLILGSPHGFHSWQDVIPQEVESSFLHKEFCTVSPESKLASFCNVVLNPAIPLKLSGPVVKYFQLYYQEQHSSVSRLLQLYNLCLMKHYMKQRDLLCVGPILLQKICDDPNLLTFSYEPNLDIPLDDEAKLEQLTKYHNHAVLWTAIVHFLFEFSKDLPGNSLGANLAEVYVLAWDRKMFNEDPRQADNDGTPFEKFMKQLDFLSYPELKQRLQNGLEVMNKFKPADNDEDGTDSRISSLCIEVQSLIAFQQLARSPRKEKEPRSPARPGLRQKTMKTMAEFQADRLAFAQKNAATANKFVSKIKELLHKLRKHLVPLHKAPLSEAFIFEDVDWLKEIAAPQVQKNLHRDLLATHKLPEEEEEPIQLDSSCLYKLVTEQKVMNVKVDDLFQAFSADQEGTADPDDDETDEEHMLFRMRQAAIELEVLGILKSNKRNSDFVTRQMWHFDPRGTED